MLERVVRFARWAGALAFVAIFVVFVAAVVMRYALHQPIQWSDEFVTIAAMWLIFWMSAFALRDSEHVTVDLAWRALPPGGRRAVGLLSAAFFGAVFAAAIPPVVDYTLFLSRKRTDILEWRYDFVFMCLPLFLGAVVVRSAATIVRLLAPGWRARVADAAEPPAADEGRA
jgi:TRAP-type C4-dicarboxylate transport system permease small subunit